ncbi:hypothetical protein GGI21_000921 [Coemansia aciculifera]|uniref:Uncharacterized protein n=1 Tax=Coemansia aciculifera TaxID=417176 RepID=A0ACC1M046_9FUNG|nr:hypothetical protein IWW38_003929 [Coemansia aciculifera]KAJ2910394.1 hypothetical protein GGI21_000921 [Coemansia aciculifera]
MSETRSQPQQKTQQKVQQKPQPSQTTKPAQKSRKALTSSAFIPAEWKVDNSAAGLIGLITEVVQAIDRQYTHAKETNTAVANKSGNHDQRTRNMSHVSVVDDRNSIFTRDIRRRGPLPRGSHATVTSQSVSTRCPGCKHKVVTIVQRHTGGKNIAATAVVTAVGLVVSAPAVILPLALTALNLEALKRKVHYCPLCNFKMGKHVTISIPHK